MPNIQIQRERIIIGAATRLELQNIGTDQSIDLGPTKSPVTIKRQIEQIDIKTDLGSTLAKFRKTDKITVETTLAQNALETLQIIWGGDTPQQTSENPITNTYHLHNVEMEKAYKLIIEGPGIDKKYRRYTFLKAIPNAESDQILSKSDTTSIPVSFEILQQIEQEIQLDDAYGLTQFPTNLKATFGTIQEIDQEVTNE